MTTSMPLRADLDYLIAPRGGWWRWSRDGQWIEWTDGRTIAARDELRAVLERLAPRGLPPLGAVLLLLAATRNGWNAESSSALIATSALTLDAGAGPGGTVFDGVIARRLRMDVAEIVEGLAAIAELGANLREPHAAKSALADYLFLDCYKALPAPAADGVVALLAEGFDVDTAPSRYGGDAITRADLDFAALRPGLARVQTENVEAWIKTGLDAPVEPADLDIPQARKVRALVRELQDDVDLSSLARMASQLLTVVHVPRDLRSQEELPLGGVSDISNRGPFDRLLISELAHDPLTLAVRVALNEALYLRREAPARHPPVTRTVLIDTGVRMWGVPRVYACAVALALVASADPADPCRVLRTDGTTTAHVDLTTRAGLQDHLAHLSPWPDPADALLQFASVTEASAAASEEIFVIVARGTFDDDAFWRKIAPLLERFTLHVATVAGDGTFQLVTPTRIGRRHVASATFDLSRLVQDRSPTKAKQIALRDPTLPMILLLPQLPLRLPARVNPRFAVVTSSRSLVGVTRDHRLMRWSSDMAGAQSLLEALPAGELRGLFVDADRNTAYACITRRKADRLILVTVDLDSGGRQEKEYAVDYPYAVVFHRGVFLLMGRQSFSVLHPSTGDIRKFDAPAGATWSSGRFFRNWSNRNLFAAADGGAVLVRADFNGLLAFDRAAHGPWMLRKRWEFGAIDSSESVCPHYAEPHRRDQPPAHFVVSADGDRVLLIQPSVKNRLKASGVDLKTAKVLSFDDEENAFGFIVGEPARWGATAGIDTMGSFDEMAVSGAGDIVLSSGRSHRRRVVIRTDSSGRLRNDVVMVEDLKLRALQKFTPLRRRLLGAAYRLREATWPDGSRAWIDSRGMLHLKSDRASALEITCALGTKGGVGGWTSDGQTFGWRFFLADEPTLSDAHAAQLLRAFAERLT